MPIDTRIDGDPESIRATAAWLRDRLAGSVDLAVDELRAARDRGGDGWQGDAGPAFHQRMDSAGRKTDDFRIDVENLASSFHSYADGLENAQAGMRQAREIAAEGGLELDGDVILEPGPAPAVKELPVDQPAAPEMVQAYDLSVAAYHDHQRKVNAYLTAERQAKRTKNAQEALFAIGRNAWDDLLAKALLNALDFANGAVGGFAKKHEVIMKRQAEALRADQKLAEERYLKARGGSTEAMRYNRVANQRYFDADEYTRKAGSVSRITSKVPIIGLGITAAGIGYDIHQGKPAGKAIISGVVGAGVSTAVGGVTGSVVAGMSAGMLAGPPGILIGAAVGIGAGLLASGTADWLYDQASDEVQDAIEGGFAAVGNAVVDAGKTVDGALHAADKAITEVVGDTGEAVGDGAKRVWNAIF
ncbi:hypothetical protein OHA21_43290 [Actinoplanes sp. NBC_00393]|uniref:hypothetical protein n=1 Tax=Actinoplanes sp. NBC_00393 TaxID=2975953 RepID=UPI002E1AAC57